MKDDKKILIILVAILLILAIGGLSLFLYSKDRFSDYYFKYNGFEVHKVVSENGVWYDIKISVGKENPIIYTIGVRNDPRSLNNVTLDIKDIKKTLIKPQLFITMDKEATGLSVVAAVEISKIVGNKFLYRVPTEGALTEPLKDQEVLVKTCEDVNDKTSIIYLKRNNGETKIYEKGGCIIIEGKDEYEIIKGADTLILNLLGVIKNE